MNREIKFRGKRIDNGEWVYGSGLQQCKDELGNEIAAIFENVVKSEKYIKKDGRYTLYYAPVKAETLGQYTGLKDKNGKDIYEGDILCLQVPDGTIRHFVIEWTDEDRILRPLSDFVPDGNPIRISGWCFNWRGYRLYPTVIDGVPDNEVMEIIGNIHDNPELMK